MSEKTKKQIAAVRNTVLNAIHADEVTMRSRYYFLARTALWAVGSILAFGMTLYLISFITFVFRSNALFALTHLGPKGIATLFLSLPWILLLLVFVVFLLLQFLSTHFEFVYRRPLIHTILGSIFVLVIGGVLIGQSTLHDRAYRFSEAHKVPLAGSFYRDAIREQNNMHIGTIQNYVDNSFTLNARNGSTYLITIHDDTRIPPSGLRENMMILLIGEEMDGVIEAIGIRPVNSDRVFIPRQNKGNKGLEQERSYKHLPPRP
ncbi:hypothetical protein JXR01_03235 [Candidatus Kaiserbacteria bacterium]|nr:MAG: hypothetical protein JXR01_03235 [Candidatus Kaiserbacteria bacterium]